MTNREKNVTVTFSAQGFYYYTSKLSYCLCSLLILLLAGFAGNNSRPELQASGAYFFRPLSSNTTPVSNTRSM